LGHASADRGLLRAARCNVDRRRGAAATAELFKALADPARVRIVNVNAVEKLAAVADLQGVCC